jgi:hypothetical protein
MNRNGRKLSNYYVGSILQSDQKKENRKRNNKNDSQSHTNTTIHTKHGLSPDSICFFCNNDEEIIPQMLVCPYCKETQIEICYNKTCKKLKVKSEEDKRKIYSIITTMISGPQDNETKEKFKHQLKHGWGKVIRGFLTNKSQAEMSQLSETIKNPKDLHNNHDGMGNMGEFRETKKFRF